MLPAEGIAAWHATHCLVLTQIRCVRQRFGIEGCEALLPGLLAMVERCAGHGVQRLEVGMAHR